MSGFHGIFPKWFPGIGHLLKEIGVDSNAYFIQSFVKGTSDFDMARILPVVGRFMPKIEVFFSNPILVSDILKSNSQPKIIAQNLETQYYNWTKSL